MRAASYMFDCAQSASGDKSRQSFAARLRKFHPLRALNRLKELAMHVIQAHFGETLL